MTFGRTINTFFYSRKQKALSLDKENDTFVEITHQKAWDIYNNGTERIKCLGDSEYYIYPDLHKGVNPY